MEGYRILLNGDATDTDELLGGIVEVEGDARIISCGCARSAIITERTGTIECVDDRVSYDIIVPGRILYAERLLLRLLLVSELDAIELGDAKWRCEAGGDRGDRGDGVCKKCDVTPGIYAMGIMCDAWPSLTSYESLLEDSEPVDSWPR